MRRRGRRKSFRCTRTSAAIRYSFKGEDLQNPLSLIVLQKSGVVFTPQDIAAAKQLIAQASVMQPPPVPMAQPGAPPPAEPGSMVPPAGVAPHPGPAQVVQPIDRRYVTGQSDEGGA